jgi:CheY-like chemotaxis protein
VLTNLVDNAVKYTDKGSVVVRVNARVREDFSNLLLRFDVEDTGIGIAPEDQVRIFDPFVQGARARKGTGLGLAISRHFVQLLGGLIQVESTLGRGSRFHVEVPAKFAEASEVMAETATQDEVIGLEPGQHEYRILIVEDLPENRLFLERLLQSAGFLVRVAEDSERAADVFAMWRPHFIWMDVRLPVMGGLEAVRRIRDMEGGREVKIAAATASAFGSQREEALASGFDDFQRKPYRPSEIFDCMARHLGVRFVYGGRPQPVRPDPAVTLRPEDFAALPAALRDQLEDAVIALDRERIALLVRQISGQNASLGFTLARLTEQFVYTPIFDGLANSRVNA